MEKYDLEERTYLFAKNVRHFLKKLPENNANDVDGRQLLRSSASVGANYVEANEALSKKDFVMHIRISRKEAKESAFFLRLICENNEMILSADGRKLFNEAIELKKILSSILNKSL